MPKLTPKQAAHHPRGYYVYELIDPSDGEVFYVGKGKGRRMYQHAVDTRGGRIDNVDKHDRIALIHRFGQEVEYRVIAEGLTEREAYQRERQRIKHYGIENLTNANGGTWTDAERAQRRAAYLAGKLKPEWLWIATRKPTLHDRRMAWGVRQFLTELGATGRADYFHAVSRNLKRRGQRRVHIVTI